MASSAPVHREDGELVGCLVPVGDLWVPCTVFGFRLADAMSQDEAEDYLHSHGLSYLAERWEHLHDSDWITVRIVEASPEQITVSFVDYGHPNLYGTRKTLHHPDMRDLRKS